MALQSLESVSSARKMGSFFSFSDILESSLSDSYLSSSNAESPEQIEEKLLVKSAIIKDLKRCQSPDVAPVISLDIENNNVNFESGQIHAKIPWNWTDPVTRKEYSGTKTVKAFGETQRQRSLLPIYQFKEQFINAVHHNQVVVVVGETGSGKSTQMPQYLLEAGIVTGRIAITQPRRVAAVSVAARVAEEVGCRVGELVGYAIRFEDITSPRTIIKYMTDGLLVMECLRDPLFQPYDCIILDEAHERTLHTDVLLGILKKALRERSELKLVITSATLDIKKFADYFSSPMVKIPGKKFPVSVSYLPNRPQNVPRRHLSRNNFSNPLWTRVKKTDLYIDAAVAKVLEIHKAHRKKMGDILLFLPGKEEVEQACSMLQSKVHNLKPLPVYAALPFEAQCEIFASAPKNVRKVVVATNIAETSITIDGILFVIDMGFFKESVYDKGIDTLKVTVISKAQAEQRAGRAGRTAPGVCYRMYTEEDYKQMVSVPAPAIHRIDLTSTVLQLKAMGIDDICNFGFMDPPKRMPVNYTQKRLRSLGALDLNNQITPLGFQMAEFPLMPNLSKILLTAAIMECSDEVLTIVSMLSVKYVFIRPKRKSNDADAAKNRFNDPLGDHLTLLNVYSAWKANGMSEEWSKKNFVHQKEMERANDIRAQLHGLMRVHGVPIVSAGRYLSNIRKALSTGEPNNVAYRDNIWDRMAYRTLVDDQVVYIHPSSALYKAVELPEYVIYHETITTTRNFIRTVSVCEESWVRKLRRNGF